MQVLLDDKGYIASFAFVGNLVGGIDIPEPEDLAHFAEHFSAYKVDNSKAAFDAIQEASIQLEAAKEDYRSRRETECFSVINRGWLWYETLDNTQKAELRNWYQSWLDGTPTQTIPVRPAWLK